MSKTNIVYLLIAIAVFATIIYFVYDARNEVSSNEITLTIDKTLEENLESENISVSGEKYLIGNYTIGAENENDFMQEVKRNKITIVYFSFEEGVGKLTKKYWGMMPNGTVEFKQDYTPSEKTYFWGDSSDIWVFNIKDHNSDRVTFNKTNPILYYGIYIFSATYMGIIVSVLIFCLSYVPPFLILIIKSVFGL